MAPCWNYVKRASADCKMPPGLWERLLLSHRVQRKLKLRCSRRLRIGGKWMSIKDMFNCLYAWTVAQTQISLLFIQFIDKYWPITIFFFFSNIYYVISQMKCNYFLIEKYCCPLRAKVLLHTHISLNKGITYLYNQNLAH